jgi:small subunit ribosomal protein S1
VLKVGETVEAQVVKIEPDPKTGQKRVGLSLRALATDPWTTVTSAIPVGSTVRGKVRKLEAFGAFVEIAPGIDGLVHVSRIAADRRISHPKQVIAVGDEVEVTVISIEPEQRRIALSMVEGARREQEASAQAERQEEAAAMAKANTLRGLGTFGDLLKQSLDKKR